MSQEILVSRLFDRIIFLFSSSASLCHGTRTSACASGGMALSLTWFSCLQWCLARGCSPPFLFTVYVDGLLEDLSKLGIGCYWDSFFVGSVCYADDLVLLAPSSALRIMLCSCATVCQTKVFATVIFCMFMHVERRAIHNGPCHYSRLNSL